MIAIGISLTIFPPDKENDVVARAKLEAKKKFGVQEQQENERQAYIQKRVKDDFGRLLSRQTAQFAGELAELTPFQSGFRDRYLEHLGQTLGFHGQLATAGKLVLDVLPALAEIHVSARSEAAAEALISALDEEKPSSDSFFGAIESLAEYDDLIRGVDRVLGQLLSQRPANYKPAAAVRPSPVTAQSTPRAERASPSPGLAGAGSGLIWKHPTTVENAAIIFPSVTRQHTQKGESPVEHQSPTQISVQNHDSLISSSSADSPSSAPMAPPAHMPPRSSRRERKPTAKALAANIDVPSRRLSASPIPSSAPSPLTRSSKSTPRVASKLGFAESASDQETTMTDVSPIPTNDDSPSRSTSQGPRSDTESVSKSPEDYFHSSASKVPLTFSEANVPEGHMVQTNLPEMPPQNSLQNHVDPAYTSNLLLLAEIAASMPESDDEDDEILPDYGQVHPGLSRALAQSQINVAQSTSPAARNNPMKTSGRGPAIRPPPPASKVAPLQKPNVTTQHPVSMPPVNTIMSAKDAQAASSLFKRLATEPPTFANENDQEEFETKSPNLYNGRQRMAEQLRRPASESFGTDRNSKVIWRPSGDITLNGTAPSHRGPTPVVPFEKDRTTPAPPAERHGPENKTARPQDENAGYEIAMNRTRMAAQARGLSVDRSMSWEQLNEMIDRHDGAVAYRRESAPTTMTKPTLQLARSGGSAHHPQPTKDIPRNTAQSSMNGFGNSSMGQHTFYPIKTSQSPATHMAPPQLPLPPLPQPPPSPPQEKQQPKFPPQPTRSMSQPNGIELHHPSNNIMKGYINSFTPGYRFINERPQPSTSSFKKIRGSSSHLPKPGTMYGDPPTSNEAALNGGPPGGGVIINTKERMDARLRAKTKAPDFKMQVSGNSNGGVRSSNTGLGPIAQAKPKKGGILISFGQN